jgi:ABC-type lipoprotein release transport system permease subunit
MIQLLKLAYRDLKRNRRRSFLSALALSIGLALLLMMASVITGEIRGAMDSSIKLQSGHLQVRAKSYDETKTSLAWEDLVENPDQIAAQIGTLAPVKAATPRLFASGIVTSGDKSSGVSILGIDPNSPADAPIQEGIVGGTFLSADDREGVLIGQPLANKFGLKAGDSINLLVNTANGDVDQQAFTVRGVFSTKTPSYDEATLFMPLTKAQAITRTENHASAIFVLLNDRDQTNAVVDALRSSQYKVLTWEDMNTLLTQTEQLSSGYMMLLYLIVLAITATVIVNTLIMSVFERTREIGILSAMGMKSSRIMAMFFIESAILAVGGIAMGLVLGGLLAAYSTYVGFYFGNLGVSGILLGERIYGYLTLQDTVSLTITAFVVTLLAGLYPAILAARMEPVDALHGGKQA